MTENAKKVARCQCITCERYLTRNRAQDGSDPQVCVECRDNGLFRDLAGPGIPLAKIRGTLTDALDLEVLALIAEECSEVVQRIGKTIRWGWDADFDGTTQADKLEAELGDVLAAIAVAERNGLIDCANVFKHADAKLAKFREDAVGPRQRLTRAVAPSGSVVETFDVDHED